MGSIPVSAIIPAFTRPGKLLDSLEKIAACEPAPREILVHIDENNQAIAEALAKSPVVTKVISSAERLGPGGGRHLLLQAANCPIVASFDDDSYPLDKDFFARAANIMEAFPNAVVVGASVFPPYREMTDPAPLITESRYFYGCGCVYRRDLYLELPGYVPLALAYGMEEVDLSLQARGAGRDIMTTEWLRVIHDRDAPGDDSEINFAMVRNGALLPFLRYPVLLFPVGVAQWLRQILWFCLHGRKSGVSRGIRAVPACLHRYRAYRQPLSLGNALAFFAGKFRRTATHRLDV